jgi:hypothetical protein
LVTPELALVDPALAEAERQIPERKAAMSSTEPSNGTFFVDQTQAAPAPVTPEPPPVPAAAPAVAAALPAVADPGSSPMLDVPLGTLIFRAGLLAEEQLEDALQEGMRTGKRLGEVLLERGWLHERDLGRLLAGQKGLPFVEVSSSESDPAALQVIPEEKARLQVTLPLRYEDGQLVVAVADPSNELVLENLRRTLGAEPRLVVAAYTDLMRAIGEAYATPSATPAAAPPSPPPLAPPEPTPSLQPEPEPVQPPAAAAAPTPLPTVVPPAEERTAEPPHTPSVQPLAAEPAAPVAEETPLLTPPTPPVEEPQAPPFETPAVEPYAPVAEETALLAPPTPPVAEPQAPLLEAPAVEPYVPAAEETPLAPPIPPVEEHQAPLLETPAVEPYVPAAEETPLAPPIPPVEEPQAPLLETPAVEPYVPARAAAAVPPLVQQTEPSLEATAPAIPVEPQVDHVEAQPASEVIHQPLSLSQPPVEQPAVVPTESLLQPPVAPPAPEPSVPALTAEPTENPIGMHVVLLRLRDGDALEVGAFPTAAEASARAQEVVAEIASAEVAVTWPFFAERYLRPDTIVSVDLVAQAPDKWMGSSARRSWANNG